ncbi:MAG: ribonuclease HII [Myxococcota bacterium]
MPAKKPSRAAKAKHERLLKLERGLWSNGSVRVAGLDEVGAGPWAGPLFAACVVLDPGKVDALVGVNDSKQLSPERRSELDQRIRENAFAFAISESPVEEIDRINIREAALIAMRRALDAVRTQLGDLDHVLIDAHTLPNLDLEQEAIVKGDATSLSIAAASIVAKVARDEVMRAMAERYPGYGFEQHKGYGTAQHQSALESLGPTPIHRRSFAPIRALLTP